jgi:hypothetical protein
MGLGAALNESQDDGRKLTIPRIVLILILTGHLLYFLARCAFPAYLIMGYSLERQSSLGVPAAPYVIQGIAIIIAFVLFALTLFFFIKGNQGYLISASIASIGGYSVNLVLVLVFELETILFRLQPLPLTLFLWGLPVITVLLYRAVQKALIEA